jgi:cytochrome c oxidase subunit 2
VKRAAALRLGIAASCVLIVLGGCAAPRLSSFDTGGPAAAAVANLGWLLIAVCALVYLATLLALLIAVLRGRRRARAAATLAPELPRDEPRKTRVIAAALIASFAILTLFVVASFFTDRHIALAERDPGVRIEITAHQWWWEIRYLDPVASRGFVTANELHLPLNETASITLRTPDVIHSFWIPGLSGKRDIIPGRDQELRLSASRAGQWRGRCAEFCGYQHAQMQLLAIAEPRADFDAWREHQAQNAVPPQTEEQQRGEQVFGSASCIGCHVIRGSSATGYSATAPDLTHLQSRRTLAAGTLPNTAAHLAAWVADPQRIKPGVRMPVNRMSADDYQSLLSYLETLQ